jgi:hypothetical protein
MGSRLFSAKLYRASRLGSRYFNVVDLLSELRCIDELGNTQPPNLLWDKDPHSRTDALLSPPGSDVKLPLKPLRTWNGGLATYLLLMCILLGCALNSKLSE